MTQVLEERDRDLRAALSMRPRHSLQRKLVWWTLAMVIVPTLLCALWLNALARGAMNEAHARNASMLSQAVAASLSGRIDGGWSPEADHVLEALFLERRLAFVVVTDKHENVLHRRSIDSDAWAAFTHQTGVDGMSGSVDVDHAMFFGDGGDIVVRRTPIWNTPGRGDIARQLQGFVLLGLRERGLPESLGQLQLTQFVAAGVVCLFSLPFILLAVRRWTAPLKALLVATVKLGEGEAPQPVPVDTRDELGVLAGAFNAMTRNLSAAHRQLRSANEELERKVLARTAELERVNGRLEAEIREKNEFFRAVSHDLGAPLRNIDGMAAMLLSKYRAQLADDALTKLERISANVKMQIDLLNDLLELSRIRTRPGKREPVDLSALVADLKASLSYDLEASGIAMEIPGALPVVVAERNRMRQVFQNLLDNAVKYMLDAKERRITLGYEEREHQLYFVVTDTGSGIDPKDQPHVFDVFRRGTHSGAHQVAGKGVGLASVKAIVECYGGSIWLTSEVGKGTAFHFTLDRKQVQAPLGACTV